MAAKGLSFRLQTSTFVPLKEDAHNGPRSIGLRKTSSGPTTTTSHARRGGTFPALTIT